MKFLDTVCPICRDASHYSVLYEANFTKQQLSVEVFSARRMPDRLHYRLVKCDNDGLVRSNPILSFGDLTSFYKKSTFTYTEEVEPLIASYMRALDPILKTLQKDAKILEIGCGNGFILEALMSRGFTNVFGVEPSTQAVSKAPKEVRKRIQVNMFSTNIFKKQKFDLLFLFQTLDHIPQPDHFVLDCEEILNSGGRLLSFHHNIDSVTSKLLKEKSPIIDVEHTQLFSLETSKKLFERCGLEVTSLYSPLSTVSVRHLVWLFPFPRDLKQMIVRHKSVLGDWILRQTVTLAMGNVCIVGKKRV